MTNTAHDKPDINKREGKKTAKKQFKPPKKITEKYLYNAGLHYLQRFPASSMHFKTVMMRKINKSCHHHLDQKKEDCVTHLNKVIERFLELGLLDDRAYLTGMVNSYRRRGLSTRQIQSKLMQKGYKADQIDTAIKNYDEENESDEFLTALIWSRRKKLGPFDTMNKKDQEKTLATLARNGFSYDIASKILELTFEEAEEILNKKMI